MNRQVFCKKQLDLLEKERKIEVEQTEILQKKYPNKLLEQHGVALLGLTVVNIRSSLGGKTLIDLEPGAGKESFSPHTFRVGDIVSIDSVSGKKQDAEKKTTGVVYRVMAVKIIVSLKGILTKGLTLEELPEDVQDRCSIFKMANDVAFTRMKDAIKRLDKAEPSPLLDCLFGEVDSPGLGHTNASEYADLEFFDESLNESQRDAIRFSLGSPRISLIHGPPGV
jgi:DNA polymerase alpha-associated DNA helicase A